MRSFGERWHFAKCAKTYQNMSKNICKIVVKSLRGNFAKARHWESPLSILRDPNRWHRVLAWVQNGGLIGGILTNLIVEKWLFLLQRKAKRRWHFAVYQVSILIYFCNVLLVRVIKHVRLLKLIDTSIIPVQEKAKCQFHYTKSERRGTVGTIFEGRVFKINDVRSRQCNE